MKKIQTRYYRLSVEEDLKNRMVFIGGPRQVGKTTFDLTFLPRASEKHPAHLNWDDITVRSGLLKGELPADQKLIILDEIHKFSGWRGLVKGFYDMNRSDTSFIITGSASWIIIEKEEIHFKGDTTTTDSIPFQSEN